MKNMESATLNKPPAVLIVDNDPLSVYLMRRYAERCGYRVFNTLKIDKALSLAKVEQPAVILVEVLLSSTSGWDILTALKNDPHTRSIPVVMYSSINDAKRGRAAGAAGYLCKPVSYSDFRETMAWLTTPQPQNFEYRVFA